MAFTERLLYLVTICVLSCTLIVLIFVQRGGASAAVMTHLEIQDTGGRTRIILGTDADGTAELRFVDQTGKKVSRLQQYRDGGTSMQFSGRDKRFCSEEGRVMLKKMRRENRMRRSVARHLLMGSLWRAANVARVENISPSASR